MHWVIKNTNRFDHMVGPDYYVTAHFDLWITWHMDLEKLRDACKFGQWLKISLLYYLLTKSIFCSQPHNMFPN